MLNQIIDGLDIEQRYIKELSKHELPLIIYGAGEVAAAAFKKLMEHNVYVDGIMVDPPIPTPNLFMNKLPIISVSETIQKYESFNVVMGFALYNKVKDIYDHISNVKSIYCFNDLYDLEDSSITYKYIKEHEYEFGQTYQWLNDKMSKDSFIAYLNTKITNDIKYLFPLVNLQMYFCNDIYKLTNEDIFIDCGAFNGDTISDFLKICNKQFRHIYAFEPDKYNFIQLGKFAKENEMSDITLLQKGAYSCKDKLCFSESNDMFSQIVEESTNTILVDTIDNVVETHPVTLIKMDIEGSELEALKGAAETIKQDKPTLAISIYHKAGDLITIPQYIKSLVPEYKFYLRIHKYLTIDTVLYAVV